MTVFAGKLYPSIVLFMLLRMNFQPIIPCVAVIDGKQEQISRSQSDINSLRRQIQEEIPRSLSPSYTEWKSIDPDSTEELFESPLKQRKITDESKGWKYPGRVISRKRKESMVPLPIFTNLTASAVDDDRERRRNLVRRHREQFTNVDQIYAKYETTELKYKGRATSSKSKESMPSSQKLKIFPTHAVDDDNVCKEKLNSSSTECIFDKIEYLNCEGLTSHRFTNVSQVNCSENVKCNPDRILFWEEDRSWRISEIVKSYCKTFKTMILENKKKEKVSNCFGHKLRIDLYDEIRKSQCSLMPPFPYGHSYLVHDTLEILYSMKHIFSIPIYELFRNGCHLTSYVSLFPVPKKAMDITLQGIKRRLLQVENQHVYITKLLFCQYISKSNPIYLLVYYRGKECGRISEVNGICVKWKQDAYVNNEAQLVMKQRPCFGKIFSPKNLPRVTAEVASRLFKQHSNLSMISSSEFKSTGYKRGSHTIHNVVCYQLFCKSKGFIPLGEPLFPTKIDSFDVDVLEGICYFGNDCVQMGTEIGAQGQRKTGAIGGFVDLPPNTTGLITCAHNLYFPKNLINGNIETDLKVYIEKCSKSKLFDESGHILKSVFRHGNHRQVSVDAALIQIDRPISASFPDVPTIQIRKAGFDPRRPPQFNSGEIITIPNRNQRVIKYGPVSELTCGTLCLDGLHVRMEKEEMAIVLPDSIENDSFSVIMYGQYGVNNTNEGLFFLPGDSGSFVFTVDEDSNLRQTLKCVGMAIGFAKGPGTCIVTPIKDVLEALGLDMKLKKFSNHNDNKDNQSNNSQSLTTEEMFKMLISSNHNLESKLDAQLKKSRDEVKNDMQNFKTEVNDSLNIIKEELSGLKGKNAQEAISTREKTQ